MIRRSLVVAFALVASACGGGPVQPDWQNDALQSLNSYTAAYLSGNTRVADAEFKRARSELARTGRFDLVARAELVRCGVQLASLEFDECPGYVALAADAADAEKNYADFLLGKPVAPALLPAQYRVMAGGEGSVLNTIESPLSRLIAAGVRLRSGRLQPADIDAAVAASSANGWRRPLLAWLEMQARQAESVGDQDGALRARRRADLVVGK